MNRPNSPIKVYRHALSGHCHRVELFLNLLDLPHTLIDVDLATGEHKRPDFLARNIFGQVPVIEDGEVTLGDSNAILVYLALRYGGEAWLPRDPGAQARVQRWLSFAAGELAAGPGLARIIRVFGRDIDIARPHAIAADALGVLDRHLEGRGFLAADAPTIADLAVYAYVAHAPEGGVPLDPWPNIRGWLARIEALPRFVAMRRTDPAPRKAA